MAVRIAAVMTCYNRKEKTIKSIQLLSRNKGIDFTFVVVDDRSTDGTGEAVCGLEIPHKVILKKGNGNSFYTGGMRIGLDYLLKQNEQYDYVLLFNDDVEFFEDAICNLVQEANQKKSVVVGTCCDKQGKMTYGAVKYPNTFGIRYEKCALGSNEVADTFCANCVLIPWEIFIDVGNMDSHYTHSFGDFDYGFSIRNSGYKIVSSTKYIGICEYNTVYNTWEDPTLSVFERIKKKESIKGLPFREWFYFLRKNFGYIKACVFSITPYIKIIVKH